MLSTYSPSLGNTAVDLEKFAEHAGRSTIKVDDVMLLTRRNEGLETILRNELKNIKTAKPRTTNET
jgi:centromere protein S